MPKHKITNSIAKAGVNYIRHTVEKANCIFQKIDQENDLGIDGLIEFIQDELPLNKQIAVQIKSGESYFNSKSQECRIPIEDHRSYWTDHPLPVYGIVFVPSLESAFWIDIKDYLRSNPENSVIKFVAIDGNKFDEDNFISIFMPKVMKQMPNISYDKALVFFHSKNQEEFFIGLTVLFRKFINCREVWNEFSNFITKASISDIPPVLIYYLAHIPWHGDIWGFGEMPTKETKQYAMNIFNRFKKEEVIKLLSIVDEEEMISRGSVGQSVEAIISSLDNCEILLKSVLSDKTISLHTREVAAVIFSINWPKPAIEYLKELEKESSWYSGELINYINEWGGFNPYA